MVRLSYELDECTASSSWSTIGWTDGDQSLSSVGALLWISLLLWQRFSSLHRRGADLASTCLIKSRRRSAIFLINPSLSLSTLRSPIPICWLFSLRPYMLLEVPLDSNTTIGKMVHPWSCICSLYLSFKKKLFYSLIAYSVMQLVGFSIQFECLGKFYYRSVCS